MSERTIEEFRLDALRLAIESGRHSRAAEFVHLVEHGCLPPAPDARPATSPAPAIEAAAPPASTAPPAPSPPYRLADMIRWTPARKALLFSLMAPHAPLYRGVTWHAFSDRLTALPGLPVSAAQARAWWEKVGAVQRVRIERRDAPAAETGDQS